MSDKRNLPGRMRKPFLHHSKLSALDPMRVPPVLVVGMHNSGTSILAEILHDSGIFMGNNMAHHESHFFSIFINDAIIMGGGGQWSNHPIMSVSEVMKYCETVMPFVRTHWIADYCQWGYDGESRWGIKDPRLCVLMPLYYEIFPESTVVHITRNPQDVAASLCQRKKMDVGLKDDFEHWYNLTIEHDDRARLYGKKFPKYINIQYEEFCTNSKEIVEKLILFLDIKMTDATRKSIKKIHATRIGSYEKWKKSSGKIKLKKFIDRVKNKR